MSEVGFPDLAPITASTPDVRDGGGRSPTDEPQSGGSFATGPAQRRVAGAGVRDTRPTLEELAERRSHPGRQAEQAPDDAPADPGQPRRREPSPEDAEARTQAELTRAQLRRAGLRGKALDSLTKLKAEDLRDTMDALGVILRDRDTVGNRLRDAEQALERLKSGGQEPAPSGEDDPIARVVEHLRESGDDTHADLLAQALTALRPGQPSANGAPSTEPSRQQLYKMLDDYQDDIDELRETYRDLETVDARLRLVKRAERLARGRAFDVGPGESPMTRQEMFRMAARCEFGEVDPHHAQERLLARNRAERGAQPEAPAGGRAGDEEPATLDEEQMHRQGFRLMQAGYTPSEVQRRLAQMRRQA